MNLHLYDRGRDVLNMHCSIICRLLVLIFGEQILIYSLFSFARVHASYPCYENARVQEGLASACMTMALYTTYPRYEDVRIGSPSDDVVVSHGAKQRSLKQHHGVPLRAQLS